jgi:2-hydroxy-6-oxonona-2,4-dienedioate hydrolase
MSATTTLPDRFVEIDGLAIRTLEEGSGVPAILLHGNSLGSSADVFRRNLGALADGGVRAIAFDMPGFGLSEKSQTFTASFRKGMVLKVMDALGLERAALIAHSSAGNIAVGVAFDHPQRVSHVIILGTGSLLPPLEGGAGKREGAAQARLEERMSRLEPTIEDTRKLLEANLFHHELITDDELALRHSRSVGECFESFVERSDARKTAPANGKVGKPSTPLWQRLTRLEMPLLMIFGKEDRGRAAERAALLKEKFPELNLHMAEGCKHLVPWDAADLFHELAVPFLNDSP